MKYVFLFWAYIHEIMFFEPSRVPLTLCFESSNRSLAKPICSQSSRTFQTRHFESAYDAATGNVIPGHKMPLTWSQDTACFICFVVYIIDELSSKEVFPILLFKVTFKRFVYSDIQHL